MLEKAWDSARLEAAVSTRRRRALIRAAAARVHPDRADRAARRAFSHSRVLILGPALFSHLTPPSPLCPPQEADRLRRSHKGLQAALARARGEAASLADRLSAAQSDLHAANSLVAATQSRNGVLEKAWEAASQVGAPGWAGAGRRHRSAGLQICRLRPLAALGSAAWRLSAAALPAASRNKVPGPAAKRRTRIELAQPPGQSPCAAAWRPSARPRRPVRPLAHSCLCRSLWSCRASSAP